MDSKTLRFYNGITFEVRAMELQAFMEVNGTFRFTPRAKDTILAFWRPGTLANTAMNIARLQRTAIVDDDIVTEAIRELQVPVRINGVSYVL